jgi:hypothetical protein
LLGSEACFSSLFQAPSKVEKEASVRTLMWASATALAVVAVCAQSAMGQGCQMSGGGGGGTTAASASGDGTTTSGGSGVRLLTGPGSLAYDVMLAQRVQAVSAQQRMIAAAQKAAKGKAYKAKVQARARERRQEELYRRSRTKANALALK